jgi:hypothetical protein
MLGVYLEGLGGHLEIGVGCVWGVFRGSFIGGFKVNSNMTKAWKPKAKHMQEK